VNIVQTVGRSCGGPIGGAIAQSIGWRWAFILQTPFTVLAMILVGLKLKEAPSKDAPNSDTEPESTAKKLKRIDFLGAFFMSTTILSAVFILDSGGSRVAWASPIIAILIGTTIVSGTIFYFVEKRWANEPIFPLQLLSNRLVVLDYLLLLVQVMSQIAVCLLAKPI
jgi:MFS family permease